MKARRVLEASRIVRATIPMLLLVRALRKIALAKTGQVQRETITVRTRTIVRKITGPFLVLAPRRTVPAQLSTIARVKPGRMRHHGRDRRATPRDVQVG